MSNNTGLIFSLNYATMQINRHGPTLMILFGTIGNILNIWVLRERSLKNFSCAIYLCWSSVFAIIFLWSGLLTRVLQGYNFNWPNQNRPLCKIRLYILSVSWAMATWTLVGASFDRFLCSRHSAIYRRWSTNRVAKNFVIGIFIFFGLLFIEALFCYESSVPNVPVACYGYNIFCQLFNDWFSLLADIIFPSICLTIFGALTIRNARSRIIHPIVNSINPIFTRNNTGLARNNDRNLTRMFLIQVFVVLILDLPFGIYRLYTSFTSKVLKSTYRVAVENLTYSLVILFVYFTHSTSFYLYTLTGTLYRAAFKRLGHRYLNYFK